MATVRDIMANRGARTPLGDFGKSLRDTPLTTLAVHAVKASLQTARLLARDVDHLVFGNTAPVDHDGLFASRNHPDGGGISLGRALRHHQRVPGLWHGHGHLDRKLGAIR